MSDPNDVFESTDPLYPFGDGLTQHRRMRAIVLAFVEPVHRAVAELEWQLTRLDTWLRDER